MGGARMIAGRSFDYLEAGLLTGSMVGIAALGIIYGPRVAHWGIGLALVVLHQIWPSIPDRF
jgi:hypothetical protein